jgi:hypothetical protein
MTLTNELCALVKICKNCCAVIFGLVLSSCATMQGPGYSYNEVVVLNQLRVPVQDLLISATESGRVFSCGNIAPRGICSNKFQPQPYRGNPIQISWMISGGRRHSEIVELEVPESFVPELPMRGVLVIDGQGGISAYLQQAARSPHL